MMPLFLNFPQEPVVELPEFNTETLIFMIVMSLLFAFLVFLFFSCRTAFFYMGETLIEKRLVPFLQEVEPPVPPTVEGKTFVGWYRDFELTDPLELPYQVRLFDVRFYAKYEDAPTEE